MSTETMRARPQTRPEPGIISRSHWRCRPYLQVCVHWPAIFAKGLARLVHGAASGHYLLVLRSESPGTIPLKQKADDRKKQLLEAGAQGMLPVPDRPDGDLVMSGDKPLLEDLLLGADADQISDDELGQPRRRQRRRAAAAAFDLDGVVHSDPDENMLGQDASEAHIVSDDDADILAGEDGGQDDDLSSSSSSGPQPQAQDQSAQQLEVDEDEDLSDPPLTELTLESTHIRYEEYICVDRPEKSYQRYVCRCPVHPRCKKRRGLGPAQTMRHGALEPFAYLLAWARLAPQCAARSHVHGAATNAEVAAAYETIINSNQP